MVTAPSWELSHQAGPLVSMPIVIMTNLEPDMTFRQEGPMGLIILMWFQVFKHHSKLVYVYGWGGWAGGKPFISCHTTQLTCRRH